MTKNINNNALLSNTVITVANTTIGADTLLTSLNNILNALRERFLDLRHCYNVRRCSGQPAEKFNEVVRRDADHADRMWFSALNKLADNMASLGINAGYMVANIAEFEQHEFALSIKDGSKATFNFDVKMTAEGPEFGDIMKMG